MTVKYACKTVGHSVFRSRNDVNDVTVISYFSFYFEVFFEKGLRIYAYLNINLRTASILLLNSFMN